jgi:hypothetical protein
LGSIPPLQLAVLAVYDIGPRTDSVKATAPALKVVKEFLEYGASITHRADVIVPHTTLSSGLVALTLNPLELATKLNVWTTTQTSAIAASHQTGRFVASLFLQDVVTALAGHASGQSARLPTHGVGVGACALWSRLASVPATDADDPFSDVTFVCAEGARVRAHRAVLAASSSYFRAMLSGPWQEAAAAEVQFGHCRAPVLRTLLGHVYTVRVAEWRGFRPMRERCVP